MEVVQSLTRVEKEEQQHLVSRHAEKDAATVCVVLTTAVVFPINYMNIEKKL